jgi:hypothetical protein
LWTKRIPFQQIAGSLPGEKEHEIASHSVDSAYHAARPVWGRLIFSHKREETASEDGFDRTVYGTCESIGNSGDSNGSLWKNRLESVASSGINPADCAEKRGTLNPRIKARM